MRLLWIVPEVKGGIRTYSNALWPAVRSSAISAGYEVLEPVMMGFQELESRMDEIRSLAPDLIHIQHEYGLFGGKIPFKYQFPKWLKRLKRELPRVRVVATGHTVLDYNYRYRAQGRGLEAPLRWAANKFGRPVLMPLWNQKTWGALDGVIVHSSLQAPVVQGSGCPRVEVIPHFVPKLPFGTQARTVSRDRNPSLERPSRRVLVFGYISPEKGQDVAIEAVAKLSKTEDVSLILAGGLRREQDRFYLEHCEKLIEKHSLKDRVKITGFVPDDKIMEFYSTASLVLAPFHETTGSGSLAQAFARSAPILASDLALNREITEREPGALEFFKSGSAEDCARQVERLLESESARKDLQGASARYAEQCSPGKVAERHLEFYRAVLS